MPYRVHNTVRCAGEFLQTAGSSTAASPSFDGNATSTTAAASATSRLALMSQAECAACPRYQVGQVADPREALPPDASYPASLQSLQRGVASVSAVCLECPDNAVCTGGR